jgi:Rho family protein|eukprot:COSAG01_NODE_1030_length_12019_cov_94.008725_8_plen_349_part_00
MFRCACVSKQEGGSRRPASRAQEPKTHKIKVCAIGDGAVGKTSLLVTFSSGQFPAEYEPTVFESYSSRNVYKVEGQKMYVDFQLWDTAGQEGYDDMRKLSYLDTDVFLIVFDVSRRTSFENVRSKWVNELRCPEANNCPYEVILAGTKSDMRPTGGGGDFVSDAEAELLAQQIGAWAYVPVSAKFNRRVSDVFDYAIKSKVLKHVHKDRAKGMNISAAANQDSHRTPVPAAAQPARQLQPQPQPQPQPQWQPQTQPQPQWQPQPQPQPQWQPQPQPQPQWQPQPQPQPVWEKRQHSDGRTYHPIDAGLVTRLLTMLPAPAHCLPLSEMPGRARAVCAPPPPPSVMTRN